MPVPTPASASDPYCTSTQSLSWVDFRVLGQLLSDSGIPLTHTQVINSDTYNDLLLSASGEVEAACTVASQYVIDPTATPPRNDLAALTGASKLLLARMVTGLAVHQAYQRRPDRSPAKSPEVVEWAREMLKALRLGEKIFGLLESARAGTLTDETEVAATVEARNGITVEAQRIFGRRNNRLHG